MERNVSLAFHSSHLQMESGSFQINSEDDDNRVQGRGEVAHAHNKGISS